MLVFPFSTKDRKKQRQGGGREESLPREWAAVVLELKKRPKPKSPSFTTPVAVMKTFAGLMSVEEVNVSFSDLSAQPKQIYNLFLSHFKQFVSSINLDMVQWRIIDLVLRVLYSCW